MFYLHVTVNAVFRGQPIERLIALDATDIAGATTEGNTRASAIDKFTPLTSADVLELSGSATDIMSYVQTVRASLRGVSYLVPAVEFLKRWPVTVLGAFRMLAASDAEAAARNLLFTAMTTSSPGGKINVSDPVLGEILDMLVSKGVAITAEERAAILAPA